MELRGEHRLPADRALTWEMLNDVSVLEACVPGAETFRQVDDGRYEVAIRAAIGPLRARFKGELEIADIDQPNGYTLRFDGRGGGAGFMRGQVRISLSAAGSRETDLTYAGHAQIGGKLAQVGSRVVDVAANTMADKFFEAFAGELAIRHGSEAFPPVSPFSLWSLLKTFFLRLFQASR